VEIPDSCSEGDTLSSSDTEGIAIDSEPEDDVFVFHQPDNSGRAKAEQQLKGYSKTNAGRTAQSRWYYSQKEKETAKFHSTCGSISRFFGQKEKDDTTVGCKSESSAPPSRNEISFTTSVTSSIWLGPPSPPGLLYSLALLYPLRMKSRYWKFGRKKISRRLPVTGRKECWEWSIFYSTPGEPSLVPLPCSIPASGLCLPLWLVEAGATRLRVIENQTIPSFIREIATTDETRRNHTKQVSSYSATFPPRTQPPLKMRSDNCDRDCCTCEARDPRSHG